MQFSYLSQIFMYLTLYCGHLQHHRHLVVTTRDGNIVNASSVSVHVYSVHNLVSCHLCVKYISSYPALFPFTHPRSTSSALPLATATRSPSCPSPSPRSPPPAWTQTTQVCPLPSYVPDEKKLECYLAPRSLILIFL